jgi:hypothetical protein
MNYYLISFIGNDNIAGHVVVASSYFPSYKKIHDAINRDNYCVNNFVISNVYQFQSHMDAENFKTGKFDKA